MKQTACPTKNIHCDKWNKTKKQQINRYTNRLTEKRDEQRGTQTKTETD